MRAFENFTFCFAPAPNNMGTNIDIGFELRFCPNGAQYILGYRILFMALKVQIGHVHNRACSY